jgi:hypothetical protein
VAAPACTATPPPGSGSEPPPPPGQRSNVHGKTHLSRSGAGAVSAGTSSTTIPVLGLTATSVLLVTLQTHASGTYLTSAVPADGTLTIHLNKNAAKDMKFAWFVLRG